MKRALVGVQTTLALLEMAMAMERRAAAERVLAAGARAADV